MSKQNKMDRNDKQSDYELLRIVHEARQQARLEEQAKWKAKIKESQKQTNKDEWVTTQQALDIVQKKSVNTLKSWVKRGLIDEPRQIGRFNYWKKSNLLKLFGYEDGKY
tara:strand:+ start:682 stop:1008 length:327 start_codon:yes stop_codon:yes gene_type:complete